MGFIQDLIYFLVQKNLQYAMLLIRKIQQGGRIMFEWRQEYAFGLDDIDQQHQRLFAVGQNLEDAYSEAIISNQYEAIREAILELDNYTEYHFDYEEDWLSLIGFKSYLSHQEDHDFFTSKIAELKKSSQNLGADSLSFIHEALSFLARWIVHHVMMADLEYVEAVKHYREKYTSLL